MQSMMKFDTENQNNVTALFCFFFLLYASQLLENFIRNSEKLDLLILFHQNSGCSYHHAEGN